MRPILETKHWHTTDDELRFVADLAQRGKHQELSNLRALYASPAHSFEGEGMDVDTRLVLRAISTHLMARKVAA